MAALRPYITERLLQNLQAGRSLNLIGLAGQGRARLLADVQEAAQAKGCNALLLFVDMSSYARSYNALLSALWQQCGPKGSNKPRGMAGIAKALAAQSRPVWLLLHRFDALHANADADKRYNLNFLDHLNSLRNKPGNALLVVTTKLHVREITLTHNKQGTLSPLDLDKERLLPLSQSELCAELRRELPMLLEQDAEKLAQAAQSHVASYDFLRYLQGCWAANAVTEDRLPAQLKRWRKDFDRQQRQGRSLLSGLSRAIRWVKAWFSVLGGAVPLLAKLSLMVQAVKKIISQRKGK